MAAILKTVKLPYLNNGLTCRHEIFYDDAHCTSELYCSSWYTIFTILPNIIATRRPASADRTARAANFRRHL